MKNIRKIVAILAAVLMLCSVIPMSAFAAGGDVIIDYNFDDGNAHFERGYVENGYMVFDATTASWQNAYLYANAMKANTDYVVTFKAKADKDAVLKIKINNNWGGDTYESDSLSVSTEWQDFEVTINSGALTGTALFLFYAPYPADSAPIYCIDDLKVVEYVEPVEPGKIINGDFETGDLSGWNNHQTVNVEAAAAHDGNYGAHLQDNGTWGGILDQTVPVEAGKSYEVSFWIQVNKFGINLQIRDGGASGTSLANGTWYDYNNHSTWTQKTYIVEPTTNAIFFNFCGGGNGTPDPDKVTDTYIDSFTVKELKAPSNDGYITNGDFEVGDLQAWDPLWWSGNISLVEGGYNSAYAMQVNHGQYQLVRQLVNVEPNTDYIVQCYAKNVSNMTLLTKNYPADQNMEQAGMNGGDNWTLNTLEFNSGDNTQVYVAIMGNEAGATAIVDNITMSTVDKSIIWSANFNDGEKKFNVGEVVAEGPDGSNCYKWDFGGGWASNYTTVNNMDFTKDYTVTFKAKGSAAGNMGITLEIGSWGTYWNGPSFGVTTEWKDVVLLLPANTVTIPSGNTLFKFQGVGGEGYTLYVDDIVISEGLAELPEQPEEPEEPEEPVYGEFVNGDFETGTLDSWSDANGHGLASIVEGHNGGYAMQITGAKQWAHIRQEDIAVDPDSTYRLTAYVKGAQNMAFVIKTANDLADMTSHDDCIFPAGDEWQKVTFEFKTDGEGVVYKEGGQPYDKVIDGIDILVIAYEAGGAVIIDDITLEKVVPHVCEFVGEVTLAPTCDTAGTMTYTCECGEGTYTEEIPAYHGNLECTPAKEAIDCANPGNIEYYFCPGCYEYFADANAQEILSPFIIEITVDCVRPEGIADCATVTCETCGNEIYGYGEHDVLACQGGTCSKCNGEIEGYGCQNYDTPACEDGVCYYCGGFVAGFGHENGAWAACSEGECSYGCGMIFPATEDHLDEDGDDYCDNCWNHLACIDEDGDGFCDVCWTEMPSEPEVDIIYGDADGDGEITNLDAVMLDQYIAGWEVEGLNMANADVDGDGEITNLDAVMLDQYIAGWDVVLGPQGPV